MINYSVWEMRRYCVIFPHSDLCHHSMIHYYDSSKDPIEIELGSQVESDQWVHWYSEYLERYNIYIYIYIDQFRNTEFVCRIELIISEHKRSMITPITSDDHLSVMWVVSEYDRMINHDLDSDKNYKLSIVSNVTSSDWSSVLYIWILYV